MAVFIYNNPVKIKFGDGTIQELGSLVRGRRVLLVTSPGAGKRGQVDLVTSQAQVTAIIADVQPNPDIVLLEQQFLRLDNFSYDVIVAMGGGSVMDTAKVLAVRPQDDTFATLLGIIQGNSSAPYGVTPIIAVPTTAGTSSEITPWATVWDMQAVKKYSLHLPELWAEACICDPALTLSLPWDVTLSTGLDVLSHSLESIWNINANPISTHFAIAAARDVYQTLPRLKNNLSDIQLREQMLLANVNAGFAFSNTRTAIAHAMSYYVTATKGVPHGIACSFTLPMILELAMEYPPVAAAARQIFGPHPVASLREFFGQLGVPTTFAAYGISGQELETLKESVNPARAGNSLVDLHKLFAILM